MLYIWCGSEGFDHLGRGRLNSRANFEVGRAAVAAVAGSQTGHRNGEKDNREGFANFDAIHCQKKFTVNNNWFRPENGLCGQLLYGAIYGHKGNFKNSAFHNRKVKVLFPEKPEWLLSPVKNSAA